MWTGMLLAPASTVQLRRRAPRCKIEPCPGIRASESTEGVPVGILDKAKDAFEQNEGKVKEFINEREEQIDQAVQKAGDAIDEKTGGKFSAQVDQAQKAVQDKTGSL